MNDSGVTVDESAPADQPQDETEKPEFPGFREGEDDGPMPEAGGSVEAPEEDAELEAARVDEEVESDTPTDDEPLSQPNHGSYSGRSGRRANPRPELERLVQQEGAPGAR